MYSRLGGPQGRSGRVRKILPPTGIRSPDRSARVESLYWLSYSHPLMKVGTILNSLNKSFHPPPQLERTATSSIFSKVICLNFGTERNYSWQTDSKYQSLFHLSNRRHRLRRLRFNNFIFCRLKRLSDPLARLRVGKEGLKLSPNRLGNAESGRWPAEFWRSRSAARLEYGAVSHTTVTIYRASRRNMPEVSNLRQHR